MAENYETGEYLEKPLRTADVAAYLAPALPAGLFGPVSKENLLEMVTSELGHRDILDEFTPYGSHLARAIGPRSIYHVVSGNTPHTALQSLTRGLLLQARNFVKLPGEGLPEVEQFISALPESLSRLVETGATLKDEWLCEAAVVVVFGSDETIATFRERVASHQRFIAHGHRVSLSVVFDDPGLSSVAGAARDASLFDQQGCLSPHVFYVAENGVFTARRYAAALAKAMEDFNRSNPRGSLSIREAAEIANLRASYRFRAASDPRVAVWASAAGTDWTVIYEEDPWFSTSCLNRLVFVKPMPPSLSDALAPATRWLGAIGIWPATLDYAKRVAALGASRICPIGKMQLPPWTWHADRRPNLADLVRWVDFEPGLL